MFICAAILVDLTLNDGWVAETMSQADHLDGRRCGGGVVTQVVAAAVALLGSCGPQASVIAIQRAGPRGRVCLGPSRRQTS